MMEDKKIERLFQEKLKDFEMQPSPLVWENIESNLTKKKKRRILPIWWFTSGIASMIVIGLLLFPKAENVDENIPFETKETIKKQNENTNIVTNQNNQIKELNTTPKSAEDNIIKQKNTPVVVQQKEELVVSNKIATQKKNPLKSALTVKGFKADGKIAMKNVLYDELNLKTKERELEKKDFIAEVSKENEKKEDQSNNSKWSVSPVFGILTSQSFTKTSAIDSKLSQNEISNPGTIAYGVNFAYQLSDKLSIKSGLQVQNMSYDTENVGIVASSVISNNLENISFNNGSNFLYINATDAESVSSLDLSSSNSLQEATLTQDLNYIEFPLELKYQVFSSGTIQTSIISGFSTLFLTKNNISAQSATFSENIGEANNLNSINFSANLGLDVEFNITRKMRLNINPMFKSQLNTFSENPTNFRPYILGVYSGLRYSF
ncbi:Outer membrane protein with beta-barrel domain [Tenacibaculum sp. 190524A05c]